MQHDSDSSGSMPESASPVRMQEGANNAAAHDALPLVERLRHTPNWMRESYGSWKDCVLTYDRSPFEAAALLAELAALKGHDPARKVPAAQGRWITLNVPAELHARLRAAVTPTAEPPAQGATQDEAVDLAAALEIRAILEQIKEVAAIHRAGDMPTPFQSAWQTCCEEIFYRATGCQWHMEEDDGLRRIEGETPGQQVLDRALASLEISEGQDEVSSGSLGASGGGAGLPFGIIDPDYARIFTMARVLAWQEGYALAMHGSFTRDLDLIAVPWTEKACEPEHLVRRVADATGLGMQSEKGHKHPHGRLVWTLLLPAFADPRFVDFGVMPRMVNKPEPLVRHLPFFGDGE
jgi:hypothetical protein